MKILLFDIEKQPEDLIIQMQDLQQIDAILCNDISEAKRILNDQKIVIVISGGKTPHLETLFDFVSKTKSEIPFIIYSELLHDDVCSKKYYEINPLNRFVDASGPNDELFNIIRNITLQKESIETAKYVRVSIQRIMKQDSLLADIYVKLSNKKIIKIVNKNEQYNKDQISKYEEKVKYLYVKTEEYPALMRSMYSSLKDKLKNNYSENVRPEAQVEGVAIICSSFENFIIDSETEKMINDIAISSIESIKKISSLKKIMEELIGDGSGYLYRHSIMIGYLTSMTAIQMNWSAKNTLEKLTVASILHDARLTNDKEAKIKSLSELEESDLSGQDKRRVNIHALEMAEMVRNLKDIPLDVDSIILTHHELPDGSGFPRGLSAGQVSQIAALFIIGEEFVNQIFDKTMNKALCIKVLDKMKINFECGNYRAPYLAFREMIEANCN